jgi:excisionase family DNA binding protein
MDLATYNDTEQITTSRAARTLGLSESMVRVLADRGQLPCTRVGSLRVFNLADVLRLRAARGAGIQEFGTALVESR